MQDNDETLGVEEGAKLLRMHPKTLRAKAKSGEIPGAKPAKEWVFLKSDLTLYIRKLYLSDITIGDKEWQPKEKSYTNVQTAGYGGTGSRILELERRNAEVQRQAKNK